jgi:hypothetical protein
MPAERISTVGGAFPGNNNGRITNAIGASLSIAAVKLTVPFALLKSGSRHEYLRLTDTVSKSATVRSGRDYYRL